LTALLAACLGMTACSLWRGGPAISDQVWMLNTSYPSSSLAENEDFVPLVHDQTAARTAAVAGATAAETNAGLTEAAKINPAAVGTTAGAANVTNSAQINQCVYQMLQPIDVKWVHFQDRLLGSSSTSNCAADTTLLGLGGAGSFVAGTTTQILHAVSAGVTGLRSSFNQDILYSQTITTILLQMEADRTAMCNIVMAKLTGKAAKAADGSALDTSPYVNMYQAANDMFLYARAGSWTHALLSIQKSAANSKGNTPSRSGSSGTPLPGGNITPSPDLIATDVGAIAPGSGPLTLLLNQFTDNSVVLTLIAPPTGVTIDSVTDLQGTTPAPCGATNTSTATSAAVTIPSNCTSVVINLKGLKPPTTVTFQVTGKTTGGATTRVTSISVPVSGK
jgi:hypothetical protein